MRAFLLILPLLILFGCSGKAPQETDYAPLTETSAARYYADLVKHYNALPLVYDVDPDLEDYFTEQALDGLFLLMAQEEARIRTLWHRRALRA
jgi:hypothetical protein